MHSKVECLGEEEELRNLFSLLWFLNIEILKSHLKKNKQQKKNNVSGKVRIW